MTAGSKKQKKPSNDLLSTAQDVEIDNFLSCKVLLVFISNDTWAYSENIWKPPPPLWSYFYWFWFNIFFFLFQFQQWRRRRLCACALLWSKLFWFWIWVLNLNFLLYTVPGINSFQYDMSWSSEKCSGGGGQVKYFMKIKQIQWFLG